MEVPHKDTKPVNKQLPPKKIKTCMKDVIGSKNFEVDIIKETRFEPVTWALSDHVYLKAAFGMSQN